jgi:hypothetical protein
MACIALWVKDGSLAKYLGTLEHDLKPATT